MDNYMNMGYNPMLRNYNGFYNRPMNQQQEVNIKGNTVWVQGYEDASAFRMEPNSVFVLLQNDLKKAYIKTTDNIGMCNGIKRFKLIEETEEEIKQAGTPNLTEYVRKDELKDLILSVLPSQQEKLIEKKEEVKKNDEPKSNSKLAASF